MSRHRQVRHRSDQTRRAFLATSACSALAAGRVPPAGSNEQVESCGTADEGHAPIVDTHMHVWANDEKRFPFAHPYDPNFEPPGVTATVELLLDEMRQFRINYCVLVQVIYHGWDNRYVARCVRNHPTRFRAQGLIDPTDENVAQKLEYWMTKHGLAGMRFSPIYYKGKDAWLNAPPAHALWRKAQDLGAVFNFFIATHQLPRLEDMVRRFPEVRVAIDHLSRIDLTAPDRDVEFKKLLALARYPNVWVKVSELSVISPSKSYPYRDTFPWVKRATSAERAWLVSGPVAITVG